MKSVVKLDTSTKIDLVKMYCFLLGLVVVGLVGSSPTDEHVKIVGGHDIDIKEAPYQVSLMVQGRHSCGGSIVNGDMIVTAAHCVARSSPSVFQIRAGSSSNTQGGQVIQVGDMVWHPDFTYSEIDNDVAVLWLTRPLKFSDSVKPVRMIDAREEIRDGELTKVTGWGSTKEGGDLPTILQMAMIPKVNSKVCSAAYSPIYDISPRMLCAGLPQGGKDACQGDSGGPLVYDDKLAGIVSWGNGCAQPHYPGVYAKVSALRSWIDNTIIFLRKKHTMRTNY